MSNVVRMCPYRNIQMSIEVKCVRPTNDHTNDHTNESLPTTCYQFGSNLARQKLANYRKKEVAEARGRGLESLWFKSKIPLSFFCFEILKVLLKYISAHDSPH